MKLIDTTPTPMSPSEAEYKAKLLKLSDPDWNYLPVHDPKGTGFSRIKILDENGNFIAWW